jgi:regulatory protein
VSAGGARRAGRQAGGERAGGRRDGGNRDGDDRGDGAPRPPEIDAGTGAPSDDGLSDETTAAGAEVPPSAAVSAAMRQWALRSLAARETSRALITRRLADKARRRWPAGDAETFRTLAAAVAERCAGEGLIDDARYADLSVRVAARRGRSRRRIAADLTVAGVETAGALAEIDEIAHALRLLRRRRLGPWDASETTDADPSGDRAEDDDVGAGDAAAAGEGDDARRGRWRSATPDERALALLTRNGFSAATARAALRFDRAAAEERLATID